ncbi:hypothetical protein [Streptomyces sp. H39-S7]|uniref:hypothetical protein n=1 Tax=Streptomyces sp. H39-S7 TaxID=3004357 RepID=UPI0022AF592D|nr:hypothetical protein [Streptomyces sp. H39-S7]MCZ4124742.1 hypothetical protein [Streptomyces sp. H39-S7]
MVEPLKSPIYKEPDPNASGGDDATPAAPLADPDLAMLWTVPGPFTGQAGAAPAPGQPPAVTPVAHGPLSVNLAAIRSTEQTMLDSTKILVDKYNDLHTRVDAVLASTSFWGQEATSTVMWSDPAAIVGGAGPAPLRPQTSYDKPVQEAAHKFAPIIGPELTRALRQVADTVEAVGSYIGRVNTAGQAYASADWNSILPDVTPSPKSV